MTALLILAFIFGYGAGCLTVLYFWEKSLKEIRKLMKDVEEELKKQGYGSDQGT